MNPNEDRNKELVLKRIKDPFKWSYGELGSFYNIHKTTAEEIFKRDMHKYATTPQITKYLRMAAQINRREVIHSLA